MPSQQSLGIILENKLDAQILGLNIFTKNFHIQTKIQKKLDLRDPMFTKNIFYKFNMILVRTLLVELTNLESYECEFRICKLKIFLNRKILFL